MASAMDRFKVSKSGGDRSRLIAEGEVEEVQLGDQPHRYDPSSISNINEYLLSNCVPPRIN